MSSFILSSRYKKWCQQILGSSFGIIELILLNWSRVFFPLFSISVHETDIKNITYAFKETKYNSNEFWSTYTHATFDGISSTFLYLPDQTRILLSKLLSLRLADAAFCHGWAELVDGVDSVDGVCGCDDGGVGVGVGVDDDLSRIRFVCDKWRTLISLRNVIIGTSLAFLINSANIMLSCFSFLLLSQKLNFVDLYRNNNNSLSLYAFLTLTFKILHNQSNIRVCYFLLPNFVLKSVPVLWHNCDNY